MELKGRKDENYVYPTGCDDSGGKYSRKESERKNEGRRRTPVGLLDGPSENDEDSDGNFTADHRRWLKGYPKGARPMPLGVLSCCHRDANRRKGTAAIARGHVHNASRTQIDRKRLRQHGQKHIQHKKVNNKKKKKEKTA